MKRLIMLVVVVLVAFTLSAYDWPQEEQDGYMHGCMGNGGAWSACNCTKVWLMKRFSIDDLKKATLQDMLDAVNACTGK